LARARSSLPPRTRRGSMKGKLISEGAQRTFAVILDTGDEA
jgi:hypothetical protein